MCAKPWKLFVSWKCFDPLLLIFLPGLDGDIVDGEITESMYEGIGKACVGDEGDIEINGGAAYCIAVVEFERGEVTGDVDDKVYFFAVEEVEGLWRVGFTRPVDEKGRNMVFCQEAVCTGCGKKVVSLMGKKLCGIKERSFLSG